MLMFLTKLPAYYDSVLNFSIETNGLLNSLIYVGFSTTLLIGPLISNAVINHSKLSLTSIRKIFQCLGKVLLVKIKNFLIIKILN